MIDITLRWIERMVKELDIKGSALDIGSLDVNGNPKKFFKKYVGVDMQFGDNVDIVCNADDLQDIFPEKSFDVVLCLNVFEHVCNFDKILENVKYLLKDGGYFFISVPSIAFPLHEYPSDYWRFTKAAVDERLLDGYDILYSKLRRTKQNKHWIIDALGQKK